MSASARRRRFQLDTDICPDCTRTTFTSGKSRVTELCDRHRAIGAQLDEEERSALPHFCHASDCLERVPPKMLMCRRHWYMVPRELRSAIWGAYVIGQEIRKDPSLEYLELTRQAIAIVAAAERKKSAR